MIRTFASATALEEARSASPAPRAVGAGPGRCADELREALIHWYFEASAQPGAPDLGAVAEAGFADEQMFLRAVIREFSYRKHESK